MSNLLELSLNYESFSVSKIDNISDLEEYINKKTDRIKLGYKMIETIQEIFNDNGLRQKETLPKTPNSLSSNNNLNSFNSRNINNLNKVKSFIISSEFVRV